MDDETSVFLSLSQSVSCFYISTHKTEQAVRKINVSSIFLEGSRFNVKGFTSVSSLGGREKAKRLFCSLNSFKVSMSSVTMESS